MDADTGEDRVSDADEYPMSSDEAKEVLASTRAYMWHPGRVMEAAQVLLSELERERAARQQAEQQRDWHEGRAERYWADIQELEQQRDRLRDGIREMADEMDRATPDRTLAWEDDLRSLLDGDGDV